MHLETTGTDMSWSMLAVSIFHIVLVVQVSGKGQKIFHQEIGLWTLKDLGRRWCCFVELKWRKLANNFQLGWNHHIVNDWGNHVFYLLFQFGKVDNTVYKNKFGLLLSFFGKMWKKQTSWKTSNKSNSSTKKLSMNSCRFHGEFQARNCDGIFSSVWLFLGLSVVFVSFCIYMNSPHFWWG